MAAQRRGSVKGSVQPEKDWLEAMATLFLLAFGEDLEEQFGAAVVKFHVAELLSQEFRERFGRRVG